MKQSKYRNRKVKYNGLVFDSEKEYKRYRELLLLERAGAITDLQTQVPFELTSSHYEPYERYSKKTGKRLTDGIRCFEKSHRYIADFVYYQDGERVVEDAKGYKTNLYKLKRALMYEKYNIRIREI